jgi:site-specific recombinase XerD
MTKALIPMPPTWVPSWDSFELSEAARSDETLRVYRTSLASFGQFLIDEQGNLPELSAVTRDDVRRYLRELVKRQQKPATRNMRYRSLRTFFGWLVREHDLPASPMDHVDPPQLDKDPETRVLSATDLKRLLATCKTGKDFNSRRDYALLAVLMEGPRRGEVVSMQVGPEYLHLKRGEGWAVVVGKTGRRVVNLADEASYAIKMYLDLRAKHRAAASPKLWLGKFGVLQADGVYNILARRADEAGLKDVHPHQLRHTFADAWLRAGGSEGSLMRAAGWKNRTMLDRYAASQADDRARLEHQRLRLWDRL